jgi:thiamine pyrophosphate-dependent acetolactate synthase large subunit-like protein
MCKGSFMVNDARRIPEFIARAMRLAFSGRRGPVHLTIPIDGNPKYSLHDIP